MDKNYMAVGSSMLILKLLEQQDMYGYQMIAALKKRSNNVFELKAGTLYPLLHGMESKGYLTSYEQEEGGKTRKYYGLTREGRKVLKGKKEEWKTYRYAVESVLKADGALAGNV